MDYSYSVPYLHELSNSWLPPKGKLSENNHDKERTMYYLIVHFNFSHLLLQAPSDFIISSDNIVFADIFVVLNLDKFKRDLAGVFQVGEPLTRI